MFLDLLQSQVFIDERQDNLEVSKSVTRSTAHDIQNSMTKQQAQATSLLDQALCLISSPRDDAQKILQELAELDDKIHALLGAVLNGNWKTQDTSSSIVSLAVR